MKLDKLKYPIGEFDPTKVISSAEIENCIVQIEEFPSRILNTTNTLSIEQLNWVYRPNGWTIKQVIHHCADSHMNAYLRTKLALTQVLPTINPYNEAVWANFIDANTDSISDSISILKGVHARWTLLFSNLNKSDLLKEYYHPENNKNYTLKEVIAMYSWHCNHHLAHIEHAISCKGIF